MRRREFIGMLGGAAVVWPLYVFAQQKPMRFGYLASGAEASGAPLLDAIKQGLRENNLIEGRDYLLDVRWAEGQYDRFPAFARDLVLPSALALASLMAAFAASIPGAHGRRWALIAAGALLAWLLVVVAAALEGDHGHVGTGVGCLRNLAVFSLPPGLLLYLMLGRAAPLDRGTVGTLASMGTSALAHVGTRFVCHNDGALHVLVWHFSFVLLLSGIGILLGRALFR